MLTWYVILSYENNRRWCMFFAPVVKRGVLVKHSDTQITLFA
jgi:hypothetical protein